MSCLRLTLSGLVLERVVKAARIVGNTRTHGMITLEIPTDAQHQSEGTIISAVGIRLAGDTVEVTGAIMPCRT